MSKDESVLIWYSGKEEKQLKISNVSRIIPGQRTICKDKDEAEVWFVGLKALITRGNYKWRSASRCDSVSSDSLHSRSRRNSPSIAPFDPGDAEEVPCENIPQTRLGKAFSDIISYTAASKSSYQAESVTNSTFSSASVDNANGRSSAAEQFRVSLSSAVSSSSHGSGHDDFDALGDVFFWGEGIGNGLLGGGVHRVGSSYSSKMDAHLPKVLESKVVLDVHNIACGGRHAVLVTRQGEIFSWGEESGGRLGHGVEVDVTHPKLIDTLSGMNIELVACGEYHTCAVTLSGDLYTWGDGTHNFGLLGHGSDVSHWIPKKVSGIMEGIHVSYISCGPWHTAVVTSAGQLFTFGDGSFGALGHGDNSSTSIPREVENLKGQRTTRVACGVWHTAAVVEVTNEFSDSGPSGYSCSGKLFTWGDGDKGRLGHGDKEPRLVPECITALINESICQVACGHNLTVALTTSGQVYTMGSTAYGQLGSSVADGKVPSRIEGKISNSFIEEIACGSYHVAVLTSKTEVYTWGKGSNGQLGHGDYDNRNTPTLVNFLKDKQVKSVVCGSNFTAVICLHKSVSSADQSICTGCHNPFGFRRKCHNCYNCGLVFCKACSSRKSLKASLAPNMNKPYRVCDDCYTKLKKALESGFVLRIPKAKNGQIRHKSTEVADKETRGRILQTTLSRLSSFGSVNQLESRHLKSDMKMELHDSRVFPAMNGNFQFDGFYSLKASPSLVGISKKVSSVSLPGSRIASRSTSPASEKSSPARFSEEILDYSKNKNDSLSQEIINLRAQVEDLTSKSQHLEAELERTSKQLEEVTAIAVDEAEKSKSAKEVIKSLTAQNSKI
uniref:FYVE-type domain-containing protein n=1 Tax=Fagus sylvatica TaxID=28930 RepID=A0A2N9F4D2_FAGSY